MTETSEIVWQTDFTADLPKYVVLLGIPSQGGRVATYEVGVFDSVLRARKFALGCLGRNTEWILQDLPEGVEATHYDADFDGFVEGVTVEEFTDEGGVQRGWDYDMKSDGDVTSSYWENFGPDGAGRVFR